MKKVLFIVSALLIIATAPGCVSSDKYNLTVGELETSKSKITNLESKLTEANAKFTTCQKDLAAVPPKIESLNNAITTSERKTGDPEKAVRYIKFADWWLNAG